MRNECRKALDDHSGQGVAAVDAEIRSGDVLGRVGEEECHGAHQVFGGTHLADGDEGDPLVAELGVLVEDFAGPKSTVLARQLPILARRTLTAQSACSQD